MSNKRKSALNMPSEECVIAPEAIRTKIAATQIEHGSKNLTVLFANISGFILLDHEKANLLCKVSLEIVDKYEGIIVNFINNRLIILFGAVITHEDDSARAVNTGLDITSAVHQFNEEQGTNLSVGIGVSSGEVILEKINSNYVVEGEIVDLAEQISKRAKTEILISESVYKNIGYLFTMRKIKSKKFHAYRVLGLKEALGKKHGVAEIRAPLIGRDKEFAVMKNSLEKIMAGKSVVTSVIGEAGIGKSRLIEEFREVTKDKVTWLSGRCPSYGQTFPYWVFLEQIRSFLGVTEFDLEPDSRQKLDAKAASLFKTKMNEYLPYLSVFLSIKVLENLQEKVKYLDPEALRLQEFVSIKALFRDIAKPKPLILYFEDMHWIDPESLELLKFLLDGLKDAPILFLFETRPEKDSGLYKIQGSLQKTFGGNSKVVTLKTLSQDDGKILIQNLLKSPKAQRISSIILEKSEGNPFYIEEMLRSLIELGLLKRQNGGWRITKGLASFEIPDTVEAVIKSRIDRLPIETRQVLGRTSVIGKSFAYKILDYISAKNDLNKKLNSLEDNGFISKSRFSSSASHFPSPKSHLSKDIEYIFKHVLIRDVAYQGMLKDLRKEIHKKVAECLEDIFREKIKDYYELLAYHYNQAGVLEKAYDYYKKAGDIAKDRYQNDIAIQCYSTAIALHKRLFKSSEREKLAELHEKRGDIHELKAEYDCALGDYENAFGYHSQIENKAETKRKIGRVFQQKGEYKHAFSSYTIVEHMLKNIPNSPVLAKTLINFALSICEGKSDYDHAEKMIKKALNKIEPAREPKIYLNALVVFGSILRRMSCYKEAAKCLKKALGIAQRLEDKKEKAIIYRILGTLSREKGNLRRAFGYYTKCLCLAEETGYKRLMGTCTGDIGIIYSNKGDYDISLKYYKRFLSIASEINDGQSCAAVSANIGVIHSHRDEHDIALDYYKRSLNMYEKLGNKLGIVIVSCQIGGIYSNKWKYKTAIKYYKRSLDMAKKIGDKKGISQVCGGFGSMYYNEGKFATALKCYKKSLSILLALEDRRGIGYMYLSIGRTYATMQRFADARKYLCWSEKILTDVDDKTGLSQVLIYMSELSAEQGDNKSANRYAKKALNLAKRIGLTRHEVFALHALGKAISLENPKTAIGYFKQSIALAKKRGLVFPEALGLYELTKIFRNIGRKKEVEKCVVKAKNIFKKIGAKYWLKKVKELEKQIADKR